MPNYQLRASRVSAVQFTSADDGLPDGVIALDGGGFAVRGERVAFGDFVIDGKSVLGRAEFERLYELTSDKPARDATPAELAGPVTAMKRGKP